MPDRAVLPLVDVEAASFRARPIETPFNRVERARAARKGVQGGRSGGGHCIGSAYSAASGKIHLVDSVVARIAQGRDLKSPLDESDLRYQKIAGRARRNIVFVVDTSESMLAAERLAQVKGCVASLLEDAYVTRARVALVGYGGIRARLVLPFTSSAELAEQRIGGMRGGGTTPLMGALAIAAHLIEGLDGEPAEVILLSDGRYDRSGAQATRRLRAFGAFCRRKHAVIHLVDAGSGKKTARRRTALLASLLQADFRTLDDLRA